MSNGCPSSTCTVATSPSSTVSPSNSEDSSGVSSLVSMTAVEEDEEEEDPAASTSLPPCVSVDDVKPEEVKDLRVVMGMRSRSCGVRGQGCGRGKVRAVWE